MHFYVRQRICSFDDFPLKNTTKQWNLLQMINWLRKEFTFLIEFCSLVYLCGGGDWIVCRPNGEINHAKKSNENCLWQWKHTYAYSTELNLTAHSREKTGAFSRRMLAANEHLHVCVRPCPHTLSRSSAPTRDTHAKDWECVASAHSPVPIVDMSQCNCDSASFCLTYVYVRMISPSVSKRQPDSNFIFIYCKWINKIYIKVYKIRHVWLFSLLQDDTAFVHFDWSHHICPA